VLAGSIALIGLGIDSALIGGEHADVSWAGIALLLGGSTAVGL